MRISANLRPSVSKTPFSGLLGNSSKPPGPIAPTDTPDGVYDDGGWWPSGTTGTHTSGRPELVLSGAQLDSMSSAKTPAKGGDTYYITAADAQDVAKQIDKQKRLEMMRYSGKPGP
jgi:hypothetical protein